MTKPLKALMRKYNLNVSDLGSTYLVWKHISMIRVVQIIFSHYNGKINSVVRLKDKWSKGTNTYIPTHSRI